MDDKLRVVLEKLAKLRALAANAGTRAEAEAAAAQAAALIAKYQIDEATVETASPAPEEIGEGDVLWEREGRNEKWRSVLAASLAEDHGCAVTIRCKGQMVSYRIVGRPSDVAIVRYLFAWLHLEIARLSESERGRAAKNAFRVGAVMGVLHAMRRARGETQQAVAQGQSTALAIVDRSKAAMGFFEAQAAADGRRIGVDRGPTYSDRDAARRGVRAGSSLAPRPGLTAGDVRPMLGTGRN